MMNRIKLCFLMLIFFSAFSLVRGADAVEVHIVLSSRAKPYVTTAEVIKKHMLRKKARSVDILDLESVKDRGLRKTTGKKDVIFAAVGTGAALWLSEKLPAESVLVYCMVSGPEQAGLSKRKNTFGVSTDIPVQKQITLIKEAVPEARTIGVLYDSTSQAGVTAVTKAEKHLPEGWRLEKIDITSHKSVSAAINSLFRKKVDMVWTFPDADVYNRHSIRMLLLSSIRRKVPVYGFSFPFVKAGALLGTSITPEFQAEQAVDLILKIIDSGGVKDPQKRKALPRSVVPEFARAVNLIVAKKISVRISDGFIRSCLHVIK